MFDFLEDRPWVTISGGLFALFVLFLVVDPFYSVWSRSMYGKAQLREAEYTRQVAVLEAKAKFDSASELAKAEVERAKGVAEANKIIGNSLQDNKEYLQYLYITGLENGAEKGATIIYVPTEGGMPVPTLDMTAQGK